MITGKEKQESYKNAVCVIVTILFLLFPFCTYLHIERAGEELAVFADSSGYVLDFFLYYKERLLLLIALFIIIAFAAGRRLGVYKTERKGRGLVMLPALLGGYCVCVLLSAICSADKSTVWLGIPGEYEGALALLVYMLLVFAGGMFFDSPDRREILYRGMMALSAVIGVLSAVEYCFCTIYELSFMKYLIAPEKYRQIAATLHNENYQGQTALAFYNPGYLGGICSLLLPFVFGRILRAGNWKERAVSALIFAGIAFALFTSTATGPLYAAGIMLLAGLVCSRQAWKEKVKAVLWAACCAVLLLFVANLFCEGEVWQKLCSVILHENEVERAETGFTLVKAELTEGSCKLDMERNTLYVGCDYEADEVYLYDTEKALIVAIGEDYQAELGGAYAGLTVYYRNRIICLDMGYEDFFYLYNAPEGLRFVGRGGVLYDEIPKPRVEGLESLYPFLTGRGYTWVQSLPLLKECLLLGKGPGSFVFHFRQEEAVGMLNTHGSYLYLVDKPHNWYLQMWINTGGLSLLCILGSFLLYMKKFLLSGNRKKEELLFLTMGILAFLISGMVNDSIIAVNPIFWLLFGVAAGMVK